MLDIKNCKVTDRKIDKLLWGSFIEQMGRAIYGGIYDKDHPTANADGFRGDVIDAVKALEVPIIRYPGGNVVSGYRWRDGVGKNRPIRLNLAWQQLEPNIIGIHEFYNWCKQVGSELMMAINLGTGTIQDALDLVEYCNFAGHSTIADERRENGQEEPFKIKYWCLGNEMDGIWQIGNLPAEEYARKAREVSKLIKIIDPEIKTTLVGSSAPDLPTYPQWEKTVLEEAYEFVDYISLHRYYMETPDGKNESYLGQYKDLERYISTVWGIVLETKERKKTEHQVYLSIDEWNIWNKSNDSSANRWLVSDRKVENIYDYKDAVLLANLIITMVKNCDKLKIGCLAQLVNVIAPIMTENGGRMFLQPTYYPYEFASKHLVGNLLTFDVDSPKIEAGGEIYESINMVGAENGGEYSLLITNNSLKEDFDLSIDLPCDAKEIKSVKVMKNAPEAVNSFDCPNTVVPTDGFAQIKDGKLILKAETLSIIMLIIDRESK